MGYAITFAQQKGGAGKTTVLAHLAAAWAGAGRDVAIIDLDPQRSLTRWAEIRKDPAITVIESKDYRAGGDIKAAKKVHDFVLIDCPGAASSLLENAMRESDLVLAPCQPSVMDVWALGPVIATATKLKRPLRILMNRMPPRMGALDEVLAELGPSRSPVRAPRRPSPRAGTAPAPGRSRGLRSRAGSTPRPGSRSARSRAPSSPP